MSSRPDRKQSSMEAKQNLANNDSFLNFNDSKYKLIFINIF